MAGKRVIGFLTAVAGLFLLAGSAWAQSPRFIVSSTPYPVRPTGVTERVGDLALTTSGSGLIAAGASLAVLIVPAEAAITNDPIINGSNLQLNGMAIPGARIVVGETVPHALFILFTEPVSLMVGDQIRIRGLRVNAQASGLDFPDQIRAQLAATPPGAVQFDNVNQVPVGVPHFPLVVTPAAGLACPSDLNNTVTCSLRVAETTPSVWTSLEQETLLSNTPPPTHPTQLQILLTNVAGGLTVEVPLSVPLVAGGVVNGAAVVYNPSQSTNCGPNGRCTSVELRDIRLIYDVTGTPDLGLPERATFSFRFTAGDETVASLVEGIGVQVRLAPISATPERARFDDTGDRRIIPRFLDRLP